MTTQVGPFRVESANRMDDAQGKRISLRLEQPGALLGGTIQQPSRFLDFDLPYQSDDETKGIVRNAWVVFASLSVVPAPTTGK